MTSSATGHDQSEWTLESVRAAAEPSALARGLDVIAFMVGGAGPTAVRLEFVRGGETTCMVVIKATLLEAADSELGGVVELVASQVEYALRMRHGRGAEA
jgi:hypothetical protein